MCLNIFFFAFVCMQLYAWAFKPSFNQSISVWYMNKDHGESYQIPLTTFLPSITVCNNRNAIKQHIVSECNDPKYWTIQFMQRYTGHQNIKYEAIPCTDLINSWTDIDQHAKDRIIDELYTSN